MGVVNGFYCTKARIAVNRFDVLLRGLKVILGHDLALLYGVEAKVLVQAVKRNAERFPDGFGLSIDETGRYKLEVTICDFKLGRCRPGTTLCLHLFTEQGVAMLSSVLRRPRAVHVNIEIMRAFVRLRQLLGSNTELARKLAALEDKYDAQFKIVFDAIRELMRITYSHDVVGAGHARDWPSAARSRAWPAPTVMKRPESGKRRAIGCCAAE